MDSQVRDLDALQDIKRIMERSSRFISLSGWSGIGAGLCGVIGALLGWYRIYLYDNRYALHSDALCPDCLRNDLILIAAGVFAAALIVAFIFTYLRSKKEGVFIWSLAARRLLWNTALPMITGGFLLLRMMQLQEYDFIAPGCLLFYGLALVNGSKYTIGEVRYLGYAEILLGVANLWLTGKGLICWAIGFGLFHIIYGMTMWWKYDRKEQTLRAEISKG